MQNDSLEQRFFDYLIDGPSSLSDAAAHMKVSNYELREACTKLHLKGEIEYTLGNQNKQIWSVVRTRKETPS